MKKNLSKLDVNELLELREEFFNKNDKALPINLGDFEELIIEIEKRTEQ